MKGLPNVRMTNAVVADRMWNAHPSRREVHGGGTKVPVVAGVIGTTVPALVQIERQRRSAAAARWWTPA